MDPLTLSLLLFTLSCFWGLLYWNPRQKLWAAAHLIPGPKPVPFLGNATLFWGAWRDSLSVYAKLRSDFGNVVRIWMGNKMMVMLCDPEDIQCVLGNARIWNRDRNFAQTLVPFTGNGLLSSENQEWKVHRRLITPMFHFKVLENYVEVFGAKAKILMEKLDEMADGKTFDIYNQLSLFTLDSICETAIGQASDYQAQGHSDFKNVIHDAEELVFRRAYYPWLLNKWIYPLTSDGRKAKPITKAFRDFSSSVISHKMAAYRKGDRRKGFVTSSGKTVTSFLDMLVEASEAQGSIMSERAMNDEVTTMAAAGLETTGVTMSALLLLIAIHPKWQDALYAEMTDVFADDMTRPATPQDLLKMAVLDRVIRETLRMFAAVAMVPRAITEDIILPSGYLLPNGCSALVVNYLVHRDAKNFPEPNKFLPDRWLPDSTANKHPYAYLPFGAGARNCIGQKYALLQMKTMLSLLVRWYTVTTDYKMEDLEKLELGIALRLGSGGYRVQLEKRVAMKRMPFVPRKSMAMSSG